MIVVLRRCMIFGLRLGLDVLAVAYLTILAIKRRRNRNEGLRLYWGPAPMINIKYISDSLREVGFNSTTVVTHDYSIYEGLRFDRYHDEIVRASRIPHFIKRRAQSYIVFASLLKSYDIVHIPFSGGPLGSTGIAWLEPLLFKLSGIRVVMLAYGSDFWRYSWIPETLVRHALLISYPDPGRSEHEIECRVKRWMRHADIVVGGFMVEGASRWDVLATNFLVVPLDRIKPREQWSKADGRSAAVKIVHAPNHRGVKGTEFMLAAIERLRKRGYAIELKLLEKVSNDAVLAAMREADICLEHCIGSGYALFAIEAMGSGSAVLSNLEDEHRIGVHRHFGWLDQCPIVSANIDQLEETLEFLIKNPSLREQLGRIGIDYVKRFHSPQMAQYLFSSIYRKMDGQEVDLMRLFHPITSDFMRSFEPLKPPLKRNRPVLASVSSDLQA